MWVERYLQSEVVRLAAQRPVVLVTGARQVGKTSLLRHVFPDHTYASLDLPSDAESAERDPAEFFQRYAGALIVDEIQHAPGLLRHLKILVDKNRSARGKFLLTGSTKFTLMRSAADSLAGRMGILELEPLALGEIRTSHTDLPLERIILRGEARAKCL